LTNYGVAESRVKAKKAQYDARADGPGAAAPYGELARPAAGGSMPATRETSNWLLFFLESARRDDRLNLARRVTTKRYLFFTGRTRLDDTFSEIEKPGSQVLAQKPLKTNSE
jgi:hypothetical protein